LNPYTAVATVEDEFEIPFEVPCNGRMKEVTIPIHAAWIYAQLVFGNKMVRDPASLSLGYVNPFKKSGTKAPMSLENEEEWRGLVQHVRAHLASQKAKNHGKGGVEKPWCITVIDLKENQGKVSTRIVFRFNPHL
jgi:hypothetical protein